jgi:hypothetical protein
LTVIETLTVMGSLLRGWWVLVGSAEILDEKFSLTAIPVEGFDAMVSGRKS